MPFVPFVRCRDVDEAIAKAKDVEHGFRHTAIIHSHNVQQHDQDGPGDGHHAVRQERPVHGGRWDWAAKAICRFPSPRRPAKA